MQVMMALGPPSKLKTLSPAEAPAWTYQSMPNLDSEYVIHFENDQVTKVVHKVSTVPLGLENGKVEVVY